MRGLAVLLALALASSTQAQDAGLSDVPLAAGIRRGVLELDDGRTLTVDGGVFLSEPTAIARAKDLERLAAENRVLRATPSPTPVAVVIGVAAGIVVGLVAGVYLTERVCAASGACR